MGPIRSVQMTGIRLYLYVGRVWLHYTDEEVMSMTPRKFKSQLDVHYDVQQRMHGEKSQRNSTDQVGYIDQIPGW